MSSAPSAAEAIRGSAVAVGAAGLLILGAAGTGKSALALALLSRGAELVADDQVLLCPDREALRMSPPAAIAGVIEARGVGLIRLPYRSDVPLALIADLDRPPPDRLPPLTARRLHGRDVPLLLCRDRPAIADGLFVLLRHGRLIDPARHGAGG